jgi:hypothetical protein
MKFDLTQSVGGRPLSTARDLLRRNTALTVGRAAQFLNVNEMDATAYITALVEAAYMQREDEMRPQDTPEVFIPTPLGISLRKSRKKRISRTIADQVVADLLKAIEKVNADTDLISRVEEADLFGSYVAGATDLGDVDVAVLMKRRLPGEEWTNASLDRADKAGRRGSFLDRIIWGETEVWQTLRAASRHLDLQPKEQIVSLGCSLKPLYRQTGS